MAPTAAQREAVKKVMSGRKDSYSVLGLDRGCSDAEVSRAYKKLAKHLHPDRNSMPQAEEAFKLVNDAKERLETQEARDKYDMAQRFGGGAPFSGSGPQGRPQGASQFYTNMNVDPNLDEFLRQFFQRGGSGGMGGMGGMGGFPRTRRPSRRQRQQEQAQRENFRAYQEYAQRQRRRTADEPAMPYMTQMLLVAALMFMSLLFILFPGDGNSYRLDQGNPWVVERVSSLGVKYYVKTSFDTSVYRPGSEYLRRYEAQVHSAYEVRLIAKCNSEISEKERLERYGRYRGSGYVGTSSVPMPACEALRDFRAQTAY